VNLSHLARSGLPVLATQWDNKIMPTFSIRIAGIFVSAALLAGIASAQDQSAPAKTASPSTSTKTQASGTSSTGAKKTTTAKPAAPLTLKTDKEKFSYAVGLNVGETLHKQSIPVDTTILLRGLRDALAGGKTALTDQEAHAAIANMQNEIHAKMSAADKKEGDAFLAANKAKSGVTTLPSGLQYKIETQGTGPKPTANDTVLCNYRGTLINGTEFDSSYKRGQPASFPVSGVIKGWTEALQLMPVGSKWQLFIPSDLAYGEQGQPRAGIGPDSTLIFEVELISIQPQNQDQKK
jgi:FKBP-type peptidyl-prolyl cis-trans isomerase FklB